MDKDKPNAIWQRFSPYLLSYLSLPTTALLAILVLVATLIVQDLSQDLIKIEAISVPKIIADNGLTAEIGSRRLRDALTSYAKKAGTAMKGPSVAPRNELPDFVVPKIGLSVDTIVSGIRSILHYGNRQTISGEMVIRGSQAWLRLRVDGEEVYSSPRGSDVEQLDQMFADAVPAIMEKIRPYLVAATIYDNNREEGFQKAQEITNRFPESDPNVQWALVLIAKYYLEREDDVEAKLASIKALRLNGANEMAHLNYGWALYMGGERGSGLAEAYRALRLSPREPTLHIALGQFLDLEDRYDQAFAEYERAVAIDPKSALAHAHFGVFLANHGKTDQAMEQMRQSAELDPTSDALHLGLATIFSSQEQWDQAAAEFRRTIELKPDRVDAHKLLGGVFAQQGDLTAAAMEFNRAIELDPKSIVVYYMLGYVRRQQNRWNEADHVFCRGMALEQELYDRRLEAGSKELEEHFEKLLPGFLSP